MLSFERLRWDTGCRFIAGIDEAGRGPLAGPVVAAAVVIEREQAETLLHSSLEGLTDSKKLSESRREKFYEILLKTPGIHVGIGLAGVEEIDFINIARATESAMLRALSDLPVKANYVLVDGRPVAGIPVQSTAIVGGDGRSFSIAAASIVAKVVRDEQMRELDGVYPHYGFARHKGYGSKAHMKALLEHGPCPVHRRSFRPVREAEAIMRNAGGLSA